MTILEELFQICSSCNCDMPKTDYVEGDTRCKYCREEKKPSPVCPHGRFASPAICRRFHGGEDR